MPRPLRNTKYRNVCVCGSTKSSGAVRCSDQFSGGLESSKDADRVW